MMDTHIYHFQPYYDLLIDRGDSLERTAIGTLTGARKQSALWRRLYPGCPIQIVWWSAGGSRVVTEQVLDDA